MALWEARCADDNLNKEQMQAYEGADRQRQALMDTFNRAYHACLEDVTIP